MSPIRRLLVAALLMVALGAMAPAKAAPTFYCGYNLDRVCRIICPRCLSATAKPIGAAQPTR